MKRVFLAALASCAAAVLGAQEPTQPQTITLTLDQAIEIALNENPTIRIADIEIERQDYVRKETVGNLLPSLSGSGQYSYAIIKQKMSKSGLSFGADNTVTVAANLNVPLFVPSVYASLKLNDAQIAEAVESARSSRVNMVNEVRKAYYNMLLLQESLDVLRESEKIMQETVDNTRMIEAELGSEYDYITAQSNLSAIMPNIIQTEGSIEVADLYMHMLLSLPNDVEITFVGDLDYYSQDIVNSTGYYSTDVSNNSDLKLLDIQERMLEAQLKMTNAQRIPTVSAFGSLSLYGNDMPEINFGDLGGGSQVAGSSKQFWWQYPASGRSISIPIFGNKINNQAKQPRLLRPAQDAAGRNRPACRCVPPSAISLRHAAR
ncbi:MAG: TolC family protein [Alistipes inops]